MIRKLNNKNKVNIPIMNCPKNFNFEFKPFKFLYFIFNKSSMKPNMPSANEINIKHQI